MESKIEISVIMCTFNETEDQIDSAVNSILNQTFKNYEFILINDNPKNQKLTNHLKDLVKTDRRIKYIQNNSNLGLATSLNIGLENAKGKYIARMDADDISMLQRLEIELDFLKRNPEISLVSTNCIDINEKNEVIKNKPSIPLRHQACRKILPKGSYIIHPSVFFVKHDIMSLGGYRKIDTAEDYDLWLRLLSAEFKIATLDIPLLKYRVRENSMTNSNAYRKAFTDYYIRSLYKKRLVDKKDDYSYSEYLADLGNKETKNCYEESVEYRLLAKKFLSKKNLFSASIYLIKSISSSQIVFENFKSLFLYKIFKEYYLLKEKIFYSKERKYNETIRSNLRDFETESQKIN